MFALRREFPYTLICISGIPDTYSKNKWKSTKGFMPSLFPVVIEKKAFGSEIES